MTQGKKAENATGDAVILNAAEGDVRDDADLQEVMQQNPIAGFFLLIFKLFESFGGDALANATQDGSPLSNFLSKTFGVEKPGNLVKGIGGKPPAIGTVKVGERQRAVNEVLGDATKSAGINTDLARGIWGIETKFGTHKTLVSPSGCSGDWQFTRGTFNDVFKKEDFRNKLIAEQGDKLEPEVKQALEEGNWKVSTEWGSDLRFHPVVSTYAAAQYMKDVSNTLGVDPMKQENFGKIYAGYNIGPGNARKLNRLIASGSNAKAKNAIGEAASWNPMFFKGGVNASTAMNRYQQYVEGSVSSYKKSFSPGAEPANETKATQLAKKADKPGSLKDEHEKALAAKTPLDTKTGNNSTLKTAGLTGKFNLRASGAEIMPANATPVIAPGSQVQSVLYNTA